MENKNPLGNMPGGKKPKMFKFNLYWMYAIIAVMLIGLYLLKDNPTSKEISLSQFEQIVQEGGIEKVNVFSKKNKVEAYLSDAAAEKVFNTNAEKLGRSHVVIVNVPSSNFYDMVKDWKEDYGFNADGTYRDDSDFTDLR